MNELGPYQRNQIYAGECAEMMSHLPEGCVDLTVTSPPYDNLRDYNGYTLDWQEVIKQLYRVTKHGGVVVWVVGEQIIDGSESGEALRQALWAIECGFRKHQTIIYEKNGCSYPDSVRYYQVFEYMFVFSKGSPSVTNLIADRKNKWLSPWGKQTQRKKDGELKAKKTYYKGNEYGVRFNIWRINNSKGFSGDAMAHSHPAPFPEALASDHIISWSNPGDLVLDPFMGSGTTAKMAMQNGRDYLGFDISPEYVELARKRVAWANPPLLVIS